MTTAELRMTNDYLPMTADRNPLTFYFDRQHQRWIPACAGLTGGGGNDEVGGNVGGCGNDEVGGNDGGNG